MPKFQFHFRALDVLIVIALCLAVYFAVKYFTKPKLAPAPAPIMEGPKDDGDSVNKLLKNSRAVNVDKLTDSNTKLRAAANNKEHVLLNQADVKDKKNYICNKECPCDERTVGESLDDIRKQFMSPTDSFYGNPSKTTGVTLDNAFKLGDGKEHNCNVKPVDKAVINGVLGDRSNFVQMNKDNKLVNANSPNF